MVSQTLATVIGLILVAALIGIDIWLAVDKLPGNTWSELLREFSKHTLFVPWSLAVLIGHWFHPVDDLEPVTGGAAIWILIALSVVLTVVGVLIRFVGKYRLVAWPAVLGGLLAGSLLWPVQVTV